MMKSLFLIVAMQLLFIARAGASLSESPNLKFGNPTKEELEMRTSEGYAVESLPQRIATSNDIGTFHSECKADAEHGTVTVSQRMTVHKGGIRLRHTPHC